MTALCTSSALMNAAMAMTSTASTLVAGLRLGAGLASVPITVGIVGTGLGATGIARLMRRSRRGALVTGYLLASLGSGVGVVAVASGNAVALCVAMLLLGFGNAGAQLSRYAAADLYPVRRRGFAIGLLVWAAAFGGVGGPLLLASSGSLASGVGLAVLSGPFLLAGLACVTATVAVSGYQGTPSAEITMAGLRSTRKLLSNPITFSSLATMVTAQMVMVAVMTATPLDMRMQGAGLGMVGMTLSAHTFGMFALSPLTGRLTDRFGARPVMAAGLGTLVASTGLVAVGDGSGLRAVALFLLGYGWNLCFLGGSTQLAAGRLDGERMAVEGAVDSAVWCTAAVASLASTAIMSATGYPMLAVASSGFAGLMTIAAWSVGARGASAPGHVSRPPAAGRHPLRSGAGRGVSRRTG